MIMIGIEKYLIKKLCFWRSLDRTENPYLKKKVALSSKENLDFVIFLTLDRPHVFLID